MGAALVWDPFTSHDNPKITPRQLAYSHAIVLQRLGFVFSDVNEALEELYEKIETNRSDRIDELESDLEAERQTAEDAETESVSWEQKWNDLDDKSKDDLADMAKEVDTLRRKLALDGSAFAVATMAEALDIERADHGVTRNRLAEAQGILESQGKEARETDIIIARAHAEIGVLRLAMAKPKRAPRKAKAV